MSDIQYFGGEGVKMNKKDFKEVLKGIQYVK